MSLLDLQKIRNQIILGYTAPIFVLMLLGGVTLFNVQKEVEIRKNIDNANQVSIETRNFLIGISKMVRNVRAQLLFPKENYYREAYGRGQDEYEAASSALDKLVAQGVNSKDWQEMVNEAEEFRKMSEEAFALIEANKLPEATALASKMRLQSMDKAFKRISEQQNAFIAQQQREIESAENMLRTVVIGGTLLAALATALLGWTISSRITEQLRKAANAISSSSSQIATTMEEQERTANLQAASVSETTTTMDELGASSRQSEEQAESAAHAAQEVLQLANNGNQAVEETVASMIDLKNKVSAIADQIVRLSEQTNQIGNISELVSDLAQQTNMLALNASVESVRAGEHGKGFAVVAQEIRKLADQSRQSAEKIGSLVSDIQNAINTTVMVTDEGTKTVNAGMNVTERTANAFGGVVEAINNVAINNQQIALNIRQQAKAVQQVLAAMDTINQGAQQTAASLTQVKTGTQQLNQTARDLQAVV